MDITPSQYEAYVRAALKLQNGLDFYVQGKQTDEDRGIYQWHTVKSSRWSPDTRETIHRYVVWEDDTVLFRRHSTMAGSIALASGWDALVKFDELVGADILAEASLELLLDKPGMFSE